MNLQPGTLYNFKISVFDEDKGGYIYHRGQKLKTFPLSASSENVIFGGDAGNTDVLLTINKLAAKENPLAVFLGGDIAYDNGFEECYCIFDRFLDAWESTMIRPIDGALIPIAPAAGNHDVGQDAYINAGTPSLSHNYFTFLKGYEKTTG